MAGVLTYPLRREAQTFLPSGLLIKARQVFQKRTNWISGDGRNIQNNSAPGKVLRYFTLCFSSFVTTVPAIILSIMLRPLSERREKTLIFPELFDSEVISGVSRIVCGEKRVFRRGGREGIVKHNFFAQIFAGFEPCYKFVSEERNEVYTDNLSVLRNRVFV